MVVVVVMVVVLVVFARTASVDCTAAEVLTTLHPSPLLSTGVSLGGADWLILDAMVFTQHRH